MSFPFRDNTEFNPAKLCQPYFYKPVSDEAVNNMVESGAAEAKVKDAHASYNAFLAKQIDTIEHQHQKMVATLQKNLDTLTLDYKQLASVKPSYDTVLISARNTLETTPDPLLRNSMDALNTALDSFFKAELTLQLFKRVHGLKQEAEHPNPYIAVSIKVIGLVVETKANAVFFTAMTDYGTPIETYTAAFIVSAMNLSLGYTAGWVFKFIRYPERKTRQKAILGGLGLVVLYFAFAYLMTLIIAQAGAFGADQALSQLFKPGNPLLLWDLPLDSIRFFLITIMFGVGSGVYTFQGGYSDKVPGYGKVSKKAANAEVKAKHAIEDWSRHLEQSTSVTLPEISAKSEELEGRSRLLGKSQALLSQSHDFIARSIEEANGHYERQVNLIKNRCAVLMAGRRGTFQPLKAPQLNNPFKAELEKIEATCQAYQEALMQLNSGANALFHEFQSRRQSARNQYLKSVQDRFVAIKSGELEEEPSASEPFSPSKPELSVIKTSNHWGGQ